MIVRSHISKTTSKLHATILHVYVLPATVYSVLLWRQINTSCTSGFLDVVMYWFRITGRGGWISVSSQYIFIVFARRRRRRAVVAFYSLEGHDSRAFRVGSRTGELFSRVALDREAQPVWRFRARASNDPLFGPRSPRAAVDVVVDVADVNDHFPVVRRPRRSNATFVVRELLPVGIVSEKTISDQPRGANNFRLETFISELLPVGNIGMRNYFSLGYLEESSRITEDRDKSRKYVQPSDRGLLKTERDVTWFAKLLPVGHGWTNYFRSESFLRKLPPLTRGRRAISGLRRLLANYFRSVT